MWLIVDDGSSDNSPQICDWFAAQDDRIKVFHKVNGGVSSARNTGLNNANGDYICFVDSDDILTADSIMNLWHGVISNKCHYAAGMCGILGRNKVKNHIEIEKVIDYKQNPVDLLEYITGSGSYSPYSKIFDTNIIKKNNLRYDESMKCSEDALFIRQYLSYCSRIVLIPKIVYEYNSNNDNSLSRKFYPDFCFYYTKKMKVLEKLVGGLAISDDIKKDFIFDRAVHGLYISIRHYLMNCRDKEQTKFLISQALDSLKMWIDIPAKSISHERWWYKQKELIITCDVEKLYKASIKEIKKERCSYTIKQFFKKVIKG
jgi:glycosyltransferase involved in cell wall biosynthesis